MANQNLQMSDEITVVRQNVRTNVLHLQSIRLAGSHIEQYFNMTSGLTFVLTDHNGDFVGLMSYQAKKIICSPVINTL